MASTMINSEREVTVSKSVAKLLQRESVMVDLFGELMDARFSIDRSTIASGKILVTQGDPDQVAEIIHKVVGEIDVLAVENDEEVLNVFNSLKEKFPGQFDTDFERSSSTFKSAFHRKVKTEVEPEVASLATKTGRFSVSRQHMNYLQCHLDHIQEDVQVSWPDSGVSITVQMEDRGQGSLLVSSKRFDFEGVKEFIETFAANIQKHSKDLEPLRALLLSSTRGQKEVRRLEKEHKCRVSVLLPGHQMLVRAESPTGHRLFLCEGNMAATDCNILVLPFSENHRDWTPTHKLILERGLLTTKTEQYARFLGCSPKARTLKLQSPRAEDGQIVVLLHVPDQRDCHLLGTEGLADGLTEALKLSSSRGACIALPLPLSVQQSLNENLKIIVRVVKDCLDKEENATTIILYMEKSSAAIRQQLVETLEKTISSRWKAMTDFDAVYEENCSSSPALVIAGQTQDIETTLRKLQSMLIPNDFHERSLLLNIGSDICTVSDSVPSNLRSKLKAGARSRGTFAIPTADLHSLEKSDFSPIQNLIKTENDGRKCSVPLENQMASVIEAFAGFGGPSLTQTYNSPVVEEAKLFVYGESAERHFGDLVKDKFTRKEIVDEIIPNMNEDELRKIKTAGQSHNVEVKIQPFAGRIIIDGMHADVFDAATEINKLIREADRYRQQAQQASMLANMVQWCFLEVTPKGTEQKEYKEHENQIIEMAYQRKKKIATIKDSNGVEYIIDFDSMKEYPKQDPNDSVVVIRKMKESSSGVLPENWTIQPDKENLKLVKLSPQNSEYQDVEKNFRSTLGGLAVTVLSIERIENPTQYRQYMAKKAHLEKQNTGIQNEKMLWHGTASDALSNINHYGFNRSYCGKNATVYGQGVYYAVNSQYSAHPTYSPPDPSTGQRYMYQCKVLVGHPVAGNNTMRFLPARSGPIQYDSSIDNPQNPSLYAIFNDTQAYPEYLITFR